MRLPGSISQQQAWLMAARPKTLPAAVAPVIIGTAMAVADGAFRPVPALVALSVSLLLQIGVNIANDYFDHVRGIDSIRRKGPVRVTQSGLIAPQRVRLGMIVVLGLAAAAGASLIAIGGWPVAALGAAAIVSALAYSGGPFPLASHGLGDLFVFVFFGLAAVCGTYYVQALRLPWPVIAASTAPGLLITAILVVNNLRDIDTDSQVGKRTMAVRLGRRGSLTEYVVVLAAAYLVPVALWAAGEARAWVLLPWLTLPLAIPLIRTLRDHTDDGPKMNKALAGTARLTLLFSLLMAAGLIL